MKKTSGVAFILLVLAVSHFRASSANNGNAKSHVLALLNQHFCKTNIMSLNFSCIQNVDQLQALFQNSQVAGRMYQISLLLIHMPIHVATSQNSSNASSEDKCCEASNTQDFCRTTAVYSRALFACLPYPLIFVFLFPIETIRQYLILLGSQPITSGYSIGEVCWTPPLPFCPGSDVGNILYGSIYQWTKCAALNEEEQHQLYIARFKSEKEQSMLWAFFLYALAGGLALLALTVLPMMRKNRLIFHPVNPKRKSLLFSSMLQFWVCFLLLYVYQFLALSVFQDVIATKSTVISTAYTPFVDIGHYAFGIMGVLYLVEFPFLLWYISTKVMAMDRRGLSSRQCIQHMLKSIGCAGMVLFMQVLSVYFVFQIAFFFTSPLYILNQYCISFVLFSFFTTCTALLFLPCITHCKRCLPHCCSIIMFILCTFISFAFLFIIWLEFRADTFDSLYDLSHILTVLFTSGLLALLAYIIKRVFTRHKVEGSPHDTTTDEEYKHLLDTA